VCDEKLKKHFVTDTGRTYHCWDKRWTYASCQKLRPVHSLQSTTF